MKIAALQMNSIPGERERNVDRAVELIGAASQEGVDLAVLPEFFNTEYFAQYRDQKYFSYAEALDGPTIERVAATAAKAGIWVIATIYERYRAGVYFDTSVVIDRSGEITGIYRKTHPAAVFSLEKLYFRYGSEFPVHKIEGWNVGISICYDNCFPENVRTLVLRGADLIICPFASHPGNPVWRQLHTIRAFENGVYLLVCNKVGPEGEWTFAGESMIIDPGGTHLAVASGTDDETIVATIDHEQVDYWRRRFPMLRDRRPDLYGALVAPQEAL